MEKSKTEAINATLRAEVASKEGRLALHEARNGFATDRRRIADLERELIDVRAQAQSATETRSASIEQMRRTAEASLALQAALSWFEEKFGPERPHGRADDATEETRGLINRLTAAAENLAQMTVANQRRFGVSALGDLGLEVELDKTNRMTVKKHVRRLLAEADLSR